MRVADRILGLAVRVVVLVWSAYVLVFGSDAGVTVTVLLVLVWGGIGVLLLWLVWCGVHWRAARATAEPARWSHHMLLLPPFVISLGLATGLGATFRLRFVLSRPAFDRFVREARPAIAGGRFTPGLRVGLFRIREAEARPGGIVRLITTDCLFDHCGVVYSPGGRPPRIGEDTYAPLGPPWWQWWRSW